MSLRPGRGRCWPCWRSRGARAWWWSRRRRRRGAVRVTSAALVRAALPGRTAGGDHPRRAAPARAGGARHRRRPPAGTVGPRRPTRSCSPSTSPVRCARPTCARTGSPLRRRRRRLHQGPAGRAAHRSGRVRRSRRAARSTDHRHRLAAACPERPLHLPGHRDRPGHPDLDRRHRAVDSVGRADRCAPGYVPAATRPTRSSCSPTAPTTQGVDPQIAAKQAAARGVRVYTIGFGTANPASLELHQRAVRRVRRRVRRWLRRRRRRAQSARRRLRRAAADRKHDERQFYRAQNAGQLEAALATSPARSRSS